MKKRIFLTLAIAVALTATGCGGNTEPKAESESSVETIEEETVSESEVAESEDGFENPYDDTDERIHHVFMGDETNLFVEYPLTVELDEAAGTGETTTGTITITDSFSYDSWEDGGLEALDGYVWKSITVLEEFEGENIDDLNLAGVGFEFDDMYKIDESMDDTVELMNPGYSFTIKNHMGTFDGCQLFYEVYGDEFEGKKQKELIFHVRLPKEYDGFLIGFGNQSLESVLIDDPDAVIFRLMTDLR